MTGVADHRLTTRVRWLDGARGLAVLAMVAYHAAWDLSHFGIIVTDVAADSLWRGFAKAIAASFLAISGVGLALATRGGIVWPAVLRRLAILSAAALAVTVATYVAFPGRYVFFGILHCIAVSGILSLAVLRLPVPAIAGAAMAVLLLPGFVRLPLFDAPALLWLGLGTVVPATNDFEPIFPWWGWMLAGLALGHVVASLPTDGAEAGRPGVLARIGRWSLLIYLVHQPILFTLIGQAAERNWLARPGLEAQVQQACLRDCLDAGTGEAVCRRVCVCTVETLKSGGWPALRSHLPAAAQSCLRRDQNLAPAVPKP